MSETKSQENQQDLFVGLASKPPQADHFPGIPKTHKQILISTTLEQILLVCMIAVLILCFIFFLGVLRGKAIAHEAGPEALPALMPKSPVSAPKTQGPGGSPGMAHPKTMTASPVAPSRALATPVPQTPELQAKKTTSVINGKDLLKPYTIQVLTTKKKEYAENEVALLKKSGFYSSIITSGDYYQVCAGLYSSKADAKKDLAYLSSKYKGCYLRRR